MGTNETTRLIDEFQKQSGYPTGPAAPVADDLQFDDDTIAECLTAVARPVTTLNYGLEWQQRAKAFLRALKRIPEIEREYVA